ncbi:MAG: T9SS type A sorting domain-containing protein [Prevotellaceae bacterium]|jgi:hypothetical protein|nr:T9SS type A sorting domain-containing protein [Prevotellaceae bacterium]
MKHIVIILCSLLSAGAAAQPTGAWRDHLAYRQGVDVLLPGGGLVVCATSVGLFFFDGAEVEKLSKASGLSGVGLTAACYDAQSGSLLVGYESGAIDVLRSTSPQRIRQGGYTKPITAWRDFPLVGRKGINRFLRVDDKVLVATNAQLLELRGEEIQASYAIDEEGADTLAERDLALFGGWIAAATPKGLYAVGKSDPRRYYFGAWQRRLADSSLIAVAACGGTLYALAADGTLYATVDTALNAFAVQGTYASPRALSVADGELWLSAAGRLFNISRGGSELEGYLQEGAAPLRVAGSAAQGYAVADAEQGLVVSGGDGGFVRVSPNGPTSNQTAALAEQGGSVVAAADGALSALPSRGSWTGSGSYSFNKVNAVAVSPQGTGDAFVATTGGVYAVAGDGAGGAEVSLAGADVGGLAFSSGGGLFAFASRSATPVHLRQADGAWQGIACAALRGQAMGKAVWANGAFWGIAEGSKLFLYAPGQNLSAADDDQAAIFAVQLSGDEEFAVGAIYALAADLRGNVWVGTDKGVLLYSATYNPFASTPLAQRIKVPTEIAGQASYLLQYERVTAIAVDGGNRKWFGTRDAGVFLQAEESEQQVYAFSEQNSPLPANTIVDIAVNSQTGEVMFATAKGMAGYYSDATAGKSGFGEAKVYPNPVRPGMEQVTITNLTEGASVKITDVAGNLVYATTANGGTATWNAKNSGGRRVATGVYLIFLHEPSGEGGKVVKLLVVN